MIDFKRKPEIVWTMPQVLSDAEQLQARQNMGAAALVSLAASFESRSPNYDWNADEVCTHDGKLWMFDRNHSGPWDAADVHITNLVEMIAMSSEKPTTILSAPIYIGGDPSNLDIYTYANAGRAQVVTFSDKCSLVFKPNAANRINEISFDPSKQLVIKRARIVTPGSLGLGAGNGKKSAFFILNAYSLSDNESYDIGREFSMQFAAFNEWTEMNYKFSPFDNANDVPYKFWIMHVNSNYENSCFYIDDYNMQSAYAGQTLQAWLEIEVESEGISQE